MLQQKTHIRCSDLIRRTLLAWLTAVLLEYWLLPKALRDLKELDGLAQMSFLRVTGLTCTLTILFSLLPRISKTAERWSLLAVFGSLALMAMRASGHWAFGVICGLVLLGLLVYGICGHNDTDTLVSETKQPKKAYLWITAGLSAAFFLFVSAWTVGRVYTFGTPTYDFGIFSQMFYNMKETGLPLTTVERDGLLSHFAVHVSPIYYLLLPFYCLAPTPATLQILQAAVMTSAVIPLWKLGGYHGLSGAQRMLICAVLLLYPAYSGGASYDIHENCFLTPLILWLFYGIDRKNVLLTGIAALLTLMVKEDAAVYVAVIALWLTVKTLLRFQKSNLRELVMGLALLAASLAWFYLVTGYLANSGDGVMTDRYKNLLYGDSTSLLTVVKSVFLNPMKALYECVDADKLPFIAMTLGPLLGLPLLTRRYERYLLLIPYILLNLMSDYPYQHDIFFQYTFGSLAFLLYLTMINLADWKRARTLPLLAAALVCAVCFGVVNAPKGIRYPTQTIRCHTYYQEIRNALDTIPEDSAVAATTFYTTHLSQRETLYDVRYCSREHLLGAEYVVLNPSAKDDYKTYATGKKENGYEILTALLEQNGYCEYLSHGSALVIYKRECPTVR